MKIESVRQHVVSNDEGKKCWDAYSEVNDDDDGGIWEIEDDDIDDDNGIGYNDCLYPS